MRTFQAIVGFLALLLLAPQTFRHVYVYLVKSRTSVLDQFQPTAKSIASAKDINELVALYRPAVEEKRALEKKIAAERDAERENFGTPIVTKFPEWEEVSNRENQLEQAIQEWESHENELRELHFFWWIGLLVTLAGHFIFAGKRKWFGTALLTLGFAEMIWATCPAFQSFGFPLEFERLLTFKVLYSTVACVLFLITWRIVEKQGAPAPAKA